MTQVYYHKQFTKEFKKLPLRIQKKLVILESLFSLSPFHPELHTKKLQRELQHLYSFRITRDYRVVFQLIATEEALFLSVRQRRDIYRAGWRSC